MTTYKNFMPVLLLCLTMLSGGALAAQSSDANVTLDQAVLQVQQDTGGKVLSAEQRRMGRKLEYRIKVLTPDGHVKVMAVSSEPGKSPASTKTTKNPAGKSAGGKEKH